tara:strand:+ start:120 stop:317 length:198 start_codon:yes stop_codon:yes gene_type:complete
MTKYLFGMYWSIGFRNGFGFDIESVDSKAVWCMDGDEMFASAFNGIVCLLPLIIITVGNLVDIDE